MRSLKFVWAALVLTLVAGGVAYTVRQIRFAREQVVEITELEARNAEWKARAEKFEAELAAAREAEQSRLPASPPQTQLPPAPREALQEREALERLRESLSAANSSIANLELRAGELEAQLQRAVEEQERLANVEKDLMDQLASANRVIAAMEKQVKSKDDRVVKLELANRALRDEKAGGFNRESELIKLSEQLQDNARRREVYLQNILSRYRDVTEQYRSLTARPDTVGGAQSSGDVSRIQSAISMAEEDLRQLQSLNSQAMRLQKKLGGN
ncbi:MAG: hypothetical protein WD696_20120 [Bryobacteraceae bacterium]